MAFMASSDIYIYRDSSWGYDAIDPSKMSHCSVDWLLEFTSALRVVHCNGYVSLASAFFHVLDSSFDGSANVTMGYPPVI